jgi:hypothetical protein
VLQKSPNHPPGKTRAAAAFKRLVMDLRADFDSNASFSSTITFEARHEQEADDEESASAAFAAAWTILKRKLGRKLYYFGVALVICGGIFLGGSLALFVILEGTDAVYKAYT